MKYLPQVDRLHWGTELTAVRVEALKTLDTGRTVVCEYDDPTADSFRALAVGTNHTFVIVELKVIEHARARWLARTEILSAAAQVSIKFKVPVTDI